MDHFSRFVPMCLSLVLGLGVMQPLSAAPGGLFPEIIPLPNGAQPEGIAGGVGLDVYVGSLATGAVVHAQVLTGEVMPLVAPREGRAAVGLKYDPARNRLFVAGGGTGQAYVYDAGSGEDLMVYQLGPTSGSLINDVVLTPRGAYFTDSFRPVIYFVPVAGAGGLPDASQVREIPLGGDYAHVAGAFNGNGIEALRGGRDLLLVNSANGVLYKLDAGSGEARAVDLGGATLESGDGLWLLGRTLYVVQNGLNQITVVELSGDYSRGHVANVISSPALRTPTTVTGFGPYLYTVNARFSEIPPGAASPDDEFEIVRLPRLH